MITRTRLGVLGVLGVLVSTIVLLAGCGSSSQRTVAATPPPVAASETQKGGQVSLAVGQGLTVTLHSTYWQFADSSDPSVVAAKGSPVSQICANPPHYPGSGCGTVVEHFEAVHPGSATLTASRHSCGEALLCRPDQASWRLTVTVR